MFANPFLADPADVLMTTTAAQFDKILENGVAGAPITFGAYTVVPLFITTFGIGAGGGSVLGEAVGGGGGGGVIPCAVLVFGPDGVELKALPHEATAAASQAVARLVSDAATRRKGVQAVGIVESPE
ncbi:spore germination protein GerW family protein [Azospirillum sp. A39]|uniref:spore germination protein GerW family protein n=1 Tax=Azospirillum sp. A39 TaxID=3462279 RepID=UPI0040456129